MINTAEYLRTLIRNRPRHALRARRGMIFVTALGICVVLGGLALIFAASMRTEAAATANRLSYVQADAIEQGAEQYVLAQIDTYTTDAMTITSQSQVPSQSVQVGNGYFWILRTNDLTDQDWDFGITDEAGKLNINYATTDQLLNLPDLTQEIVDSITNYRGDADVSDGGDSTYYNGLPEPYNAKLAPYETVEELLLVEGMTPQILFGLDLNRNGVVDQYEQNSGGANGNMTITTGQTISDSRGIFPFITCYSHTPVAPASIGGRGGRGAVTPQGQVNVNTAGEGVLMALSPSITQAMADSWIGAREGQDYTDTSEFLSTIGQSASGGLDTNLLTGTSYQYSADIVAVSGDGRAFKRVRIVVDCQTAPAKIIYRRDLTNLGWPLPLETRTQLRSGQGITPGETPGYDNQGM